MRRIPPKANKVAEKAA